MLEKTPKSIAARLIATRNPTLLGLRVLDALIGRNAMSKAEIARILDVGRGSVNRVVDQLVDCDLLHELTPGRYTKLPQRETVKGAVLRQFLDGGIKQVREVAESVEGRRSTVSATLRILYAEGWLKRHMHGRYCLAS